MTTLQEQFNAIKNGKGNKVQFLKQARSLFPQYLNQYSDFNTSVNVLKSKQIINEAVGGVVTKGFNITNWKQIFEAEAKAEEKTTSKEAADANKSAYQPSNVKNADNINFNEILKGYLAELGDVKNAGKTGDELKEIAVKNLAKDPLFYTKSGNFGIKGVGYTTEAPGLGEPKEAKGKHKSSGYGDIDKEIKVKANVKDSLGSQEAKDSMPKKVKEMTTTPQSSAGVKKMKMPGAEKKMKLQEIVTGENPYFDTDPSDGSKLRSVIAKLIKEELNEISPELFKRATDVSRERGQDRRTISMGQAFFNKFKGKPLMNGTIIDVSYVKPQQGRYENVIVKSEVPSSIIPNETKIIYNDYKVTTDEWDIDKEITRADARILSLIAQHINPDTRYKSGGEGFQIKGY